MSRLTTIEPHTLCNPSRFVTRLQVASSLIRSIRLLISLIVYMVRCYHNCYYRTLGCVCDCFSRWWSLVTVPTTTGGVGERPPASAYVYIPPSNTEG